MHKIFQVSITACMLTCTAVSSVLASQMTPPVDIGVINKERILYWLTKRGELSPTATIAEQEKAFQQYITRSTNTTHSHGALHKKLPLEIEQAKTKPAFLKQQVSKNPQLNSASTNIVSTAKVLAIMIDFKDLKHDNHGLQPSDTDMYYSEYPRSHYEDLLFSATGYAGPSGQNIESAYQYYKHESGESFAFTGEAYGWVTADNNAEHYGANNNNENDSNTRELVIEAVTKAVAENNINLADYDQDGNGVVDHIMIFHSSIGEESGGGNLGSNAIWSHRFFVFDNNNQPISVEGSTTKIFGYTINPIDAATGVVVHEFGHDLGVPDEYDTTNSVIDSPVQVWSLMASGTWLGSPRGTEPSSFSPYAKEYFQNVYGGNWVNQQTVTYSDTLNETVNLNAASNHESGINQIRVNLPPADIHFGQPYAGSYQYYSNTGNSLANKLTFTTVLQGNNPTLTMKARWDIEQDYDYVTIKVNNQVIAGNHTIATNRIYQNVSNFISGQSSNIVGASTPLGWVDLTFDLSAFANQNITVDIEYITDRSEGGYGFAADEIRITSGTNTLFANGAETLSPVILGGFSRITDTNGTAEQYYYIQLRDHTDTDSGLTDIGYDPGVLVWYRNESVENNNVSQHPGEVFVGVVDADQNLIRRNNTIRTTEFQVRDAAFSLYDQTPFPNDTSLSNNPLFDDSIDYSSPLQPESGIKLPILGLHMEVVTQATDSSTTTLLLTKNNVVSINKTQNGLSVTTTVEDDDINNSTNFTWNMGDGTQLTGNEVNHTYASAGNYDVTVTYSTAGGNKQLLETVTVGTPITGNLNLSANNAALTFSSTLTGGQGNLSYRWIFGDNKGSSTQSSGIYTYANAGNYTVTLTVTDETGESFAFTQAIAINNPLITSFNTTENNLSVDFSSDVSGGSRPYSYLWDFGDNQTSTVANPTHVYATGETYQVTLTITDANDLQQSSTRTLTLASAQVATPTTSTASSDSGSGGGSMHWLFMLLVGAIQFKRYKGSQH